MVDNGQLSRDDLVDALLDLKHDLGKYIRLPVVMLPVDATAGELRGAVKEAIERTRKGPAGVRSARQIWQGFLDEAGDALADSPALGRLTAAVERALALSGEAQLERAAVEAELAAVGEGIRQLIEEVVGE